MNHIEAKVVFLGEPYTGKTSLINNLIELNQNLHKNQSIIEYQSYEIPSNRYNHNVSLRVWEYPSQSKISIQEQELSLRSTLITIITVDLRSPETLQAAFDKWYQIKTEKMSESFLYVIGTHMDCVLQRRIDVLEICKLCAQKDAIYLEISNIDKFNIDLLRKFIAQKLSMMLEIKNSINNEIGDTLEMYDVKLRAHTTNQFDIMKGIGNITIESAIASNQKKQTISTPTLEPELLYSSIGNILSSSMRLKQWPGMDALENDDDDNYDLHDSIRQLEDYTASISEYIDKLGSQDSTKLPVVNGNEIFNVETKQISSKEHLDMSELLAIFDRVGYTANVNVATAPPELSQKEESHKLKKHRSRRKSSQAGSVQTPLSNTTRATTGSTEAKEIQTRRTSQTGESAVSPNTPHGVARDTPSNSQNMSSQQLHSNQISAVSAQGQYISSKKCRVRVQLPKVGTDGGVIDIKINVGDDVIQIVRELAVQHDLSEELEHKIANQLKQAC